MGKAFMLVEGRPSAVGGAVPAGVRGGTEEVQEREELGKVFGEEFAALVTGDRVEHFDNVEEEEGMG